MGCYQHSIYVPFSFLSILCEARIRNASSEQAKIELPNMFPHLPFQYRHLLRLLPVVLLGIAILFAQMVPAIAQSQPAAPAATAPAPTPSPATSLPSKVEDLLKLMADPDVQKWVAQQKAGTPVGAPAETAVQREELAFDAAFERVRHHLEAEAEAIPRFPAELGRLISTLEAELAGYGPLRVLLLIGFFIAAGFIVQWIFWRLTAGARRWMAVSSLHTTRSRLMNMAARLLYGTALVGSFALGSIGVFLAFAWPPTLRQIVLGYLMVVLIVRAAYVVLDFLLAPPKKALPTERPHFRVLPVSDQSSAYWTRKLTLIVGWFAFGFVTVSLLNSLGFPPASRLLVAYALGIVLLALGIEAVWHRPVYASVDAEEPANRRGRSWLLTLLFVTLWILWVASAMRLFWILAAIVALPAAIRAARRAVHNVLDPVIAEGGTSAGPSVIAAVVERGVRAALIIATILFVGNRIGLDYTAIAAQETMLTRLVRGALTAVIILLAADFVWQVVKTLIDQRIQEASKPGVPGTEAARRKDRVRTLLPIARNVLMIVVAVMAVLMALSSLGVEIGPLIAGAGIVGVAVGFGAQTVVKDVISGIFYLLDDAFRVGEYIQSGSYKGTVESFSLRSVMLRHHRGAVYTVPFSALGAIQNMSRDWAIDKITITITYDSDPELARKLIKKIGLELAQDPEFAASTIEPLKMQGIDEFGDSGMILRMKIKTKPGEQFAIKRRALKMIRQAFEENNIKLAVPTVQVAGEAEGKAAAAQAMLAKAKADAAAQAAAESG